VERKLNPDLGQFWTPHRLVDFCASLVRNKGGRLLEPSCGNGAFYGIGGENSVYIEIDKGVISEPPSVLNMDFFEYSVNEKFNTIIGNPPFVDNSKFVAPLFSGIRVQANLYLYFMEKCFHHLAKHGELIFIVPREFIKLTSAGYVNKLLCENGTITDYYDFGDEKFFDGACPNVCVFRYERDNFSHITKTFAGVCNLVIKNGIISFTKDKNAKTLGDYFDIKVGAVSGADDLFISERGDDFVCSETKKTGVLRKMIYERPDAMLEKHKDKLMSRGIKKFNESNWWSWGRPVNFQHGRPRIYVNCKTRQNNPFFMNDCERWDGSLLALFPKDGGVNMVDAVAKLNDTDWETLGFMTGGRYCFSQKSLTQAVV
jgi:adenine-specific DNA-methyltransferase